MNVLKMKQNKGIGSNWKDARNQFFIDKEINTSNMRVAAINEFIAAK